MTYTHQQKRRLAEARRRYESLLAASHAAELDGDTQEAAELQEAATSWLEHAERLANKAHARRNRQGVK